MDNTIISAAQLAVTYVTEYPAYTREQWREEVVTERTILGYWEWVHSSLQEESGLVDSKPSEDDVFALVVGLLKQTAVSANQITEKMNLSFDLGLDSIDLVSLEFDLEQHLGISFEGSCLEAKTVGDIVQAVHQLRS